MQAKESDIQFLSFGCKTVWQVFGVVLRKGLMNPDALLFLSFSFHSHFCFIPIFQETGSQHTAEEMVLFYKLVVLGGWLCA